MEIPTEWYVHIIPGIIILASLIPILKPEHYRTLQKFCESQLLGSAILLGLAGYIIGFVGNIVALEILKPVLNFINLLDKPQSPTPENWALLSNLGKYDLIKVCEESYQGMILNRSLFGAFVSLTFFSFVGLLLHKNKKKVRIIFLVLSIIITYSLCEHWLEFRQIHYKFINAITKTAEQANNNKNN